MPYLVQEKRPRNAPKGARHVSAASLDTNASGLAESTISLGLSRFPEPPSSIPTSLRSKVGTASTFKNTSTPSVAPLYSTPHAASNPPTTYTRYADSRHSFKPPNPNSSRVPAEYGSHLSSSSHIFSPYDWHDGASSIDVDATEDRLLPTSFITSLLQENKELRRSQRTSYASEAFSGISGMTYPPVINQSETDNLVSAHYSSGRVLPAQRPQDSQSPPSAYSQPSRSLNRMSGDSETLHSIQGYPSIIRTASIPQGVCAPGVSVVSVTPAVFRSASNPSQISSIQDSNTLRSIDKGFQANLSTTYELGDELTGFKSLNPAYSPASHSTAGTQRRLFKDSRPDPELCGSVHSSKSVAATFMSRVSGVSLRRMFPWKKIKPLPPVPIIPDIPVATQNAHRKLEESAPLPDLVNRAGALRELLENGHHPYRSISTFHTLHDSSASYGIYEADSMRKSEYPDSPTTTSQSFERQKSHPPSGYRLMDVGNTSRKRRTCILITVFVIAALAAIGISIGLTVGKKKQPEFNCPGNLTGSACNLDATCICTSTSQCNGLAQSVINLLPVANQAFKTNITAASAYSNIWSMQGSPTTTNCASQAILIDVGTGIDQASFPNRTQWAQAALLWNVVQTQDTASAQRMQWSIQSLPWKTLSDIDGPVPEEAPFSLTSSGFIFNFASQTVTQPPASFVTLGQPTKAQIARVSTEAQSTLDRMYSFAQASSIQRQSALKKYWTSVLFQRPEDLAIFKTAISISPIMLPFDASSASIRDLYISSPSSPFPPPLACFPGLSSAVHQQINTIESGVYDLPPVVSPTQFNPSCYRGRPVYGVLDVLRLRLPFFDTRAGVARQAAVLMRDASPRVVLYNGEIFSATVNNTTTIASSQLDPRQYGTLSLFDHVVLRYLSSIPDVSVARALVKFVLDTATKVPVPPDGASILFQSLESIPVLEVAVFGDVGPPDLTSTVSPFTNPSGSLFFGSNDGNALRNWTISAVDGVMVWTQNATSPLVVRDNSMGDNAITQTWNAIALAIDNNIPNIGVPNITTTLTGTQKFSP